MELRRSTSWLDELGLVDPAQSSLLIGVVGPPAACEIAGDEGVTLVDKQSFRHSKGTTGGRGSDHDSNPA